MPSPCDVIETAYREYVNGWGVQGERSGAALYVVGELVAHGLVADDQYGEASIEARVIRVVDEHEINHDGRMNFDRLAAEVALALGLASRDEASDYAGCAL